MNAIPNLTELLRDRAKVSAVPAEAIPALRGELAELDSLLLARLVRGAVEEQRSGAQQDRLLNAKEAAMKLGSSKDYLYRHASKLPFTVRVGRQLRFSETGIERFIRQRMDAK